MARYKRVLLKLSGEVLAGDARFGIQPTVLRGLAEEIRDGKSDVRFCLAISEERLGPGWKHSVSPQLRLVSLPKHLL